MSADSSFLNIPGADAETGDAPLTHAVRRSIDAYFAALDGHEPSALYRMVLAEVERPLLEAVLAQTQGNQCRAAAYLGISRGTLRKKLKEYNLG
ncbi:DNA-binding transcriptional regulator Fis [Acidihalobacter ferrooxydans]|uniref:Putative Fis-like DNA-binding protein n=1 Tax=Acidihalobacter ferrooxydans TaxID=1765967 RepID=A0A1P8UJM6_9GAMM|nr:DNA-binding transcriptional regulator Fis [Acidihalobacter ferrooxydans]APZ44047.1 Fis family transcriptional regulator [Acidihalobacter ferrooxydans]